MEAAQIEAIERACERVAIAYAQATDACDADAAAALWTEDGVLEMPGNRRYGGREAIRRRVLEQPADSVSCHLLANLLVTVLDAGHATGTSLLTIYRGSRPSPGAPVPLAGPYLVGRYEDAYRRTDGGWRLARRRLTTLFRRPDA